jgi:hypothetical protein
LNMLNTARLGRAKAQTENSLRFALLLAFLLLLLPLLSALEICPIDKMPTEMSIDHKRHPRNLALGITSNSIEITTQLVAVDKDTGTRTALANKEILFEVTILDKFLVFDPQSGTFLLSNTSSPFPVNTSVDGTVKMVIYTDPPVLPKALDPRKISYAITASYAPKPKEPYIGSLKTERYTPGSVPLFSLLSCLPLLLVAALLVFAQYASGRDPFGALDFSRFAFKPPAIRRTPTKGVSMSLTPAPVEKGLRATGKGIAKLAGAPLRYAGKGLQKLGEKIATTQKAAPTGLKAVAGTPGGPITKSAPKPGLLQRATGKAVAGLGAVIAAPSTLFGKQLMTKEGKEKLKVEKERRAMRAPAGTEAKAPQPEYLRPSGIFSSIATALGVGKALEGKSPEQRRDAIKQQWKTVGRALLNEIGTATNTFGMRLISVSSQFGGGPRAIRIGKGDEAKNLKGALDALGMDSSNFVKVEQVGKKPSVIDTSKLQGGAIPGTIENKKGKVVFIIKGNQVFDTKGNAVGLVNEKGEIVKARFRLTAEGKRMVGPGGLTDYGKAKVLENAGLFKHLSDRVKERLDPKALKFEVIVQDADRKKGIKEEKQSLGELLPTFVSGTLKKDNESAYNDVFSIIRDQKEGKEIIAQASRAQNYLLNTVGADGSLSLSASQALIAFTHGVDSRELEKGVRQNLISQITERPTDAINRYLDGGMTEKEKRSFFSGMDKTQVQFIENTKGIVIDFKGVASADAYDRSGGNRVEEITKLLNEQPGPKRKTEEEVLRNLADSIKVALPKDDLSQELYSKIEKTDLSKQLVAGEISIDKFANEVSGLAKPLREAESKNISAEVDKYKESRPSASTEEIDTYRRSLERKAEERIDSVVLNTVGIASDHANIYSAAKNLYTDIHVAADEQRIDYLTTTVNSQVAQIGIAAKQAELNVVEEEFKEKQRAVKDIGQLKEESAVLNQQYTQSMAEGKSDKDLKNIEEKISAVNERYDNFKSLGITEPLGAFKELVFMAKSDSELNAARDKFERETEPFEALEKRSEKFSKMPELAASILPEIKHIDDSIVNNEAPPNLRKADMSEVIAANAPSDKDYRALLDTMRGGSASTAPPVPAFAGTYGIGKEIETRMDADKLIEKVLSNRTTADEISSSSQERYKELLLERLNAMQREKEERKAMELEVAKKQISTPIVGFEVTETPAPKSKEEKK